MGLIKVTLKPSTIIYTSNDTYLKDKRKSNLHKLKATSIQQQKYIKHRFSVLSTLVWLKL